MTQPAPLAPDESQRLRALRRYAVLDTEPESGFDDLVQVASHVCGTPMSLVSLVDDSRQWFKASVGLDVAQTSRDVAFCAHAILEPDTVMQVSDATKDERFMNNPLVTGEPNIVFYAGAPLVTPQGDSIGTLCVLGTEAKELDQSQLDTLAALSRQVVAQLELRLKLAELRQSNEELDSFAYVAAHDLRAPLRGIKQLAGFLEEDASAVLSHESLGHLQTLQGRIKRLDAMLDSLLTYARIGRQNREPRPLNARHIMVEAADVVLPPQGFTLRIVDSLPAIFAPPALAALVFRNLLMNAVKHHDCDSGVISIESTLDAGTVCIKVSDDGPGIPAGQQQKIFELFSTLKRRDELEGSGIGLAMVKKVMQAVGGSISVSSGPGRGTTFSLNWPCPPFGLQPVEDSC